MTKRIALIPNAKNPLAETIRERTRCAVCHERIETGQEVEDRLDEDGTIIPVWCLEQ